jgi:hypothetical protein
MIDAAPRGSVRGGLAPLTQGRFAVRHYHTGSADKGPPLHLKQLTASSRTPIVQSPTICKQTIGLSGGYGH